jgi:hypothetical protein
VGQLKFKQPIQAPTVNSVKLFNSTAAIIKNRLVRIAAVAGNVKHTTGTSGRSFIGVALNAATGAGKPVWVQFMGIADIHASTRAVVLGVAVRASSGAASTGSGLGGTVRGCTVTMTTAVPIRANIVGIALTSAAAAAAGTNRTVSVLLMPSINNPII